MLEDDDLIAGGIDVIEKCCGDFASCVNPIADSNVRAFYLRVWRENDRSCLVFDGEVAVWHFTFGEYVDVGQIERLSGFAVLQGFGKFSCRGEN